MKETEESISLMDRIDYDELLCHTGQRLKSENDRIRLEALIANKILLKRMDNSRDKLSSGDFVQKHFDAVYAEVLDELLGDCLRYNLSKLKDPDVAQDITQEAMMQLLTSQKEIRDAKAWLLSVCHNLICSHYREKTENHAMLKELEREDSVCRMISSAEDFTDSDMDELARVPGVVDCPEYAIVREMSRYPSLGEYASAKGISYEQAKQLSKSSKRDLRAKCLRHFGWTVTADILGYTEYKSIQRYLRRIFEVVKDSNSSSARKNKLRIKEKEIEAAFSGVVSVADWTVTLRGENTYELFLVCFEAEEKPRFVQIRIVIQPNHRIETISCVVKQPLYVIKNTGKVNFPTDKGVVPMSPAEVADLISHEAKRNPDAQGHPEHRIRIIHGKTPPKK